MIGLEFKEARVFVPPGSTDMRKQMTGWRSWRSKGWRPTSFTGVVSVLQRGTAHCESAVLGPHRLLSVAEPPVFTLHLLQLI